MYSCGLAQVEMSGRRPPARDIHPRGVAFALSAAILWGFVPVYIGFVNAVDAVEIVVHRALWSGLILYALVMFTAYDRRHQARLPLSYAARLGLSCPVAF